MAEKARCVVTAVSNQRVVPKAAIEDVVLLVPDEGIVQAGASDILDALQDISLSNKGNREAAEISHDEVVRRPVGSIHTKRNGSEFAGEAVMALIACRVGTV